MEFTTMLPITFVIILLTGTLVKSEETGEDELTTGDIEHSLQEIPKFVNMGGPDYSVQFTYGGFITKWGPLKTKPGKPEIVAPINHQSDSEDDQILQKRVLFHHIQFCGELRVTKEKQKPERVPKERNGNLCLGANPGRTLDVTAIYFTEEAMKMHHLHESGQNKMECGAKLTMTGKYDDNNEKQGKKDPGFKEFVRKRMTQLVCQILETTMEKAIRGHINDKKFVLYKLVVSDTPEK